MVKHLIAVLCVKLGAALLLPVPALAEQITGSATVHDGDTIKIEGESIRLYGIDAPELKQTCRAAHGAVPCGEMARDNLARLIDGHPVTCVSKGRDKYGRIVGKCFAQDDNLSILMVMEGWAVPYYVPDYDGAGRWAAERREGMWEYDFIEPCKFRGSCK